MSTSIGGINTRPATTTQFQGTTSQRFAAAKQTESANNKPVSGASNKQFTGIEIGCAALACCCLAPIAILGAAVYFIPKLIGGALSKLNPFKSAAA